MANTLTIELPLSKSIVNRLLTLIALRGERPESVGLAIDWSQQADDIRIMHHALFECPADTQTIDIDNCGTAMRFLTAYFAQLRGREVVLTGCERMQQRPIGQLVEALRTLGADIEYIGQEGYPPLRIVGTDIARRPIHITHPLSTQFVSALLLIGVPVDTDTDSPYITLTEEIVAAYDAYREHRSDRPMCMKTECLGDWSAAAFWYEYIALHGGRIRFTNLAETGQGDRIASELFARLGVRTQTEDGETVIEADPNSERPQRIEWDFKGCPDLYPAAAICCERLGIELAATGTESLPLKESDRLRAIAEHKTYNDHRIAMALLAADLPCDNTACVSKSYPSFLDQLRSVGGRMKRIETIVPRRGINDEGKGKKYALGRLISGADADYVWLQDDDIVPAPASAKEVLQDGGEEVLRALEDADMLILPLRMEPAGARKPNLLERLQMAEYAAIQQLTLSTAQHGHAVLCSGANLVVNRQAWLSVQEELHPEIPSGDDMFLLEALKRKGCKIGTIPADYPQEDAERLTATVRPIREWKAFFRQRMRWAGKAPAYTDRDILVCGAVVAAANIAQLVCPIVVLIKFPIDYSLIRKREPKTSIWVALLLAVLYPYYMLVCLIGGIVRTKRLKKQNW